MLHIRILNCKCREDESSKSICIFKEKEARNGNVLQLAAMRLHQSGENDDPWQSERERILKEINHHLLFILFKQQQTA